MNRLRGIIIFTAIELVVLVAWGLLLDLGRGLPLQTQIGAAVVLAIGLFLEHVVATNVGQNRPLFDFGD